MLLLLHSPPLAAHPSLYFNTGDIASLQSRTTDESENALGYDFASAFAQLQTLADQYKTSPCTYTVQIPDPDGIGSQEWTYTVSSAMPPGHPNNPGYPPWTGLSRLIQRRLEIMAFVYTMTGDPSYLTNQQGYGALDLVMSISSWSQWTDPAYACGGQTCLDTAHLTMGAAMIYDLGFDAMSSDERTTLQDAIVQLGIIPLAADVRTANQNGDVGAWFNGYAIRVTGLAVGSAAIAEDLGSNAETWLSLAHDSVEYFFNEQGSDGGTYEGQEYGSYAMDQLVTAAHVLEQAGMGQGLFDNAWLQSLPRFAAAFLGSKNKKLANFGDSALATYWGSTMMALAAHGNAHAQWYLSISGLSKPSSPRTFIWANPELVPEAIEGSGTSLFLDVGHAALRAGFEGDMVVAVKSGPPSVDVGHNHLDHNSFIISAYGEWIAGDPGYRSYFNVPERIYTSESVGHNTIMVDKWVSADGKSVTGGQVSRTGGSLEYLFDGKGYAKLVAKASSAYEPGLLSRFDRRIFYAKPDLVLVFDDIAAPESHEYSFLLHSGATSIISQDSHGPSGILLTGQTARLQSFLVSTAALKTSYPLVQQHTGAQKYGSYAEWRTNATAQVRISSAHVPGQIAHTELTNPGFEQGLLSWQARFSDGSHSEDTSTHHGGSKSAKISFDESRSGYYYSEPMTVLPSASVTTSVFVLSSATGHLGMQLYWMKDGAYIANPGGDFTSLDAAAASDWTQIELNATVPSQGVDALRISINFTGTGTVWFDDASFETNPRFEPTPLSHALALGDPPSGLVVQGPFGIEAAASLVGSGASGPTTLYPSSNDIPSVQSLSSDGSLFALGLDPWDQLKRAYVQGGSYISLGQTNLIEASKVGSFDLAVIRDHEGCATLYVTQVPTLQAAPYRVRVQVQQVMVDEQRVPFVIDGEDTVFPQGEDLGPGCPSGQTDGGDDADGAPGPDAGQADGDAGTGSDTGTSDSDGTDSGSLADSGDSTQQDLDTLDAGDSMGTDDASNQDHDIQPSVSGGCSCHQTESEPGLGAVFLLLLALGLALCRKRQGKTN